MQNVIRALITLLIVLLAAPAASAQDLDFQFKTVVKGKDLPALIVTPARPLKALSIELTDDAGKKQRLRAAGLRPGKSKRLTFKQAAGTSHYKANIEVKWGDTGEVQLFAMDFDATRVGELKILISAEDVDLDENKLSCRATNPVRRVELTVLGENGKILDDVQQSFEDSPAPTGEPIELTWTETEEKIIRMDLRVTDIAGFYTGMRIMPFTIEIPHDEVVFEFGRADVRDSEAPKLVKTMDEINEALKTHGTLLTLKLYVGGYTDTVGGKPSNRELSQRRARAIATWFRAHGLKIPIYYQGFGEDVLAVPTPDETEEERNRRAVYILSSQTPTGEQVPGKAWHRL
ncbi:MAG: hypothetical protein CVU56_25760 [Deltaproteobacteria bacterium HGW-Deltaproteobacteria-14]|jgi:outer membrane protein OmpA-like peptidoglycan-associated protein|nr:MAG: hypothetical protein CVU56_25760 [Deltaproteobacteria bacterium HGW-Deltaproteobacteria-14]